MTRMTEMSITVTYRNLFIFSAFQYERLLKHCPLSYEFTPQFLELGLNSRSQTGLMRLEQQDNPFRESLYWNRTHPVISSLSPHPPPGVPEGTEVSSDVLSSGGLSGHQRCSTGLGSTTPPNLKIPHLCKHCVVDGYFHTVIKNDNIYLPCHRFSSVQGSSVWRLIWELLSGTCLHPQHLSGPVDRFMTG